MSLWKKVTSFLFEETEADIIAEDDLEAISLKEKDIENFIRIILTWLIKKCCSIIFRQKQMTVSYTHLGGLRVLLLAV